MLASEVVSQMTCEIVYLKLLRLIKHLNETSTISFTYQYISFIAF